MEINPPPSSHLVSGLLERASMYEEKYGPLCKVWIGPNNPDPGVYYNDAGAGVKRMYESTTDTALVTVEPLISSVNTADINTIQGTYPIKPTFTTDPETHTRCTPGSEFVGIVKESASSQEGLQPGRLVLPRTVGLGSWCSSLPPLPAHHFIPVSAITDDPEPPIEALLAMQVNPSSALVMLEKFGGAGLRRGDVVVLTAATSAVATAASSIAARVYGCAVVAVARRRDRTDGEWEALCESLREEHHASMVLSEEEVIKTPPKVLIEKVKSASPRDAEGPEADPPQVPLCLDCVGGKVGSRLAMCLSLQGTHVTYGGLSRSPVSIRAGASIFSDIRYRGFWLTRWAEKVDLLPYFADVSGSSSGSGVFPWSNKATDLVQRDERVRVLSSIYEMVEEGVIKLPRTSLFHLSDYEGAFNEVGKGTKVAFDCRVDEPEDP